MKLTISILLVALGIAEPVVAQNHPTGPVTLVVPYSPSGNVDIFVRHLAPYLKEIWGQPVVVKNLPGGGSMVGSAMVTQARPDGLTLLVTTSAYVTAPAIQPNLPFDPREDLVPVANVGYLNYILITSGRSDLDTFDKFVADGKENPKFGATAGIGTATHFALEKFIQDSGALVDVVHYKGGGPAIVSILSGETDIYVSSVTTTGENLTSGRVRALAVLGNERIDALPNVPSTGELGYPDLEIKQWVGMFAPAGTAPAIIEKLNADVNVALKNEAFVAKVRPLDWNLQESTPGDFADAIDEELTLWKSLAEARGISQ